ncbi:hypothetical protein TPHA_0L02230 [Tetrapisispora phaffii CBS 4417]|uniref:rRNA-processing protein EFG1 n=1 Tax=Tetrapisispora phaffii (strain ATCC 24235 / CBS 4417 / NBRC 1672 / NRRL Y-8282 / UCD 70-5) TaxID=1071381 RepID=G8C096_TETPH|nr:hypothetical protein TPHA_0L02230 [Tetrapisispora phaffii CBS 4417]CCE65574.1 hypothetical protein TPHA_0L02230 [Tetrapisispora phaffii CBS 4417]
MARIQRRRNNAGSSLEMAQFIDAGVNKIKKRIRDIERLLKKKGDILPDTVIVEKERTLEALKIELENAHLQQKIKQNAKKYHMIKFFERKKAMRKYKKAAKAIEDDSDNKEKQAELLKTKIDLCYVVNFPKSEKYIALYPSNENEDNTEDTTTKEKSDIKKKYIYDLIIKQFQDNTLPVSFKSILEGKKLDKQHNGIRLEADREEDEKEEQEYSSSERKTKASNGAEAEEEEDDFFE